MAVRDDFTAGEVLAAADLNDTFASKPPFAYGTATPSTTVEGFIWYDENDTPPTAYFWDGSAFEPISAPSGLSLITPTSIANSGGSASASGGAVTFSGVTSVSLNGCFSATYLNYKIVINLTANSATGPTDLNFRYRITGSDQTSSNYYMGFNEIAQAGGLTTSVANPASAFLLGRHGTGVPGQTFFLESADPFVSGTHHQINFEGVTQTTGGGYAYRTGVGDFIGSGSMDGFSLVMATNTFTGTIRCYGYQNS